MEGSESEALVPSDTCMEAEIWVKLSNFPAEFLTSLAIRKIVSAVLGLFLTSLAIFQIVFDSPTKHHKWRDKSVVLGLFEKLDLMKMLSRLGAVTIDWAVCYGDPPDFEAALGEDFHNFEQGFCVVKSSTTHHKWRDKSEMQGLFCISFDELILLKTFLAATFLDLLIFKIQHKWRDKGLLI